MSFLRRFGTKVIVQIPKEKRTKFDAKGEEGIFVGYEMNTKGYKVYLQCEKKFIVSKNVVFLSKDQDSNLDKNDTNLQQDGPVRDQSIAEEETPSPEPEEKEELEVVEIDYDWDSDSDGENDESVNAVCLFSVRTPDSFVDLEKMESEEKAMWLSAVRTELDAMERYQVWEIAEELPPSVRPIDTMWVFQMKKGPNGDIAKARLVAKGCQIGGNKGKKRSNYAPVASVTSVRCFLALVVHFKMKWKQLDVETAFLNGVLKEQVWIKVPQGYEKPGIMHLKLLKALYGLPQAPRCWYDRMKEVLLMIGFRVSRIEPCLFILVIGDDIIIFLAYVDDFFIAGTSVQLVTSVISKLQESFTVKVMPKIETFIGFHLNVCDEFIDVHQTPYIEANAKKFNIEDSKPILTPMENKLDLKIQNSDVDKRCVKKFQKLLGVINFIMERSRPDVNYSTNKLSRYTLRATEELHKYLGRVLKYLWTTRNLSLRYLEGKNEPPLEAYCDASWASEENSKSTTGYLIRVYGNLVHFKSRKQKLVALSTAEYVALSECARDVMWIRNLLIEVGVKVGVCVIFCDNQAAMKIAAGEGNYN